MARLRRSSCDEPGIRRIGRGRGFSYSWDDGAPVSDPAVLDRIRSLAIPPAWNEVWICAWPNGHLQARGVDAAGRFQYRYHDAWRVRRDAEKFDRMLAFGKRIGTLRDRVDEDLDRDGACPERVQAAAVRLLDKASLRIGGAEYAHDHETYGLTTLRRAHVRLDGSLIRLHFAAKTGRDVRSEVVDADVADVLRSLKRRRGDDDGLFAWKADRRWHLMHASDVNEYLKATIGQEFSAKDFRTWNATVRCAVELAEMRPPTSGRGRRRCVNVALEAVAQYLGNTTQVCRRSYVDPRVLDAFEEDDVIRLAPRLAREHIEAEVLDLCESRGSPSHSRVAAA